MLCVGVHTDDRIEWNGKERDSYIGIYKLCAKNIFSRRYYFFSQYVRTYVS